MESLKARKRADGKMESVRHGRTPPPPTLRAPLNRCQAELS